MLFYWIITAITASFPGAQPLAELLAQTGKD